MAKLTPAVAAVVNQLGRTTEVAASVDRLGFADEPGVESMIAALRTYAMTIRSTFDDEFAAGIAAVRGYDKKTRWYLPWQIADKDWMKFLAGVSSAAEELARAYDNLARALARDHDLIVLMLADEHTAALLAEAARMARRTVRSSA
jgi:hypothetical protein